MLLLRFGGKHQSTMIAAERFSSQYRSKLNRLFTILLIHVLFPLRPRSARGDMVQIEPTFVSSALAFELRGSLQTRPYVFNSWIFSLNYTVHFSKFLINTATTNIPKCKFKNRSSKCKTFSVNTKHLYQCIQNNLLVSKMQLKFVVAKYTIAQNYQSKYAHTLNTIPSFILPSLSHQVRVSRMVFKQFKFLIKKIVTLFCSNY